MANSPPLLVALLMMVALPGCVSDDISVREKGVPMATVRMSFDRLSEPDVGLEGEAVPDPSRVMVELSGTYAWDDLSSQLGDFSLLEAAVSAKGGGWGSETVQLHFIGGVAYSHLALEIDTGGPLAMPSLNRYGPIFGAELTWEVVPRLAIYGRATYALLIPDTTSGQAEAGLRVSISDNVRLIGGYRHWRYRHEDIDLGGLGQPDLDLEIDGYLFGFDLIF